MDAGAQITQGRMHRPMSGHAPQIGEARRADFDAEMALA